ncbi:Ig-like domain-containing protein [Raoultibacter timonensis]|uniref:BIG2 domain-containing protein n=1 Tax=Raoultibacter timonensis TaxID=1907662 RepID=A0ABN6MHB3_9ACTN|nr:Ig-like domain-containing protein [Raoultibacter timonensis]BDE97405.1 hypothetical protein CE91St30_27380 [Raoultibacter timonensis]BDF52008.1 hypothetical protein CE91St31_27380 [Raoultibacter timonensis]
MDIVERILDLKNTFEGKCLAVLMSVMLVMSCVSFAALADDHAGQPAATATEQSPASTEDSADRDSAFSASAGEDSSNGGQGSNDEGLAQGQGVVLGSTEESESAQPPAPEAAPETSETVLSDEALVAVVAENAYVAIKGQTVDSSQLKTVLHQKLEFVVVADTGFSIDAVTARNSASDTEVAVREADGVYSVDADQVDSNLVIAVATKADEVRSESNEGETEATPLDRKSIVARSVPLSSTDLGLAIGSSGAIEGSTGGNNHQWIALQNDGVVSIDSALNGATSISITGLKAGTATFKHTWYGFMTNWKDNEEHFTVTISEPVGLASASIAGVASMEIGTEATLSILARPSGATINSVTWSSSDDSIASVDSSGKVSAKQKTGTVTITAFVDAYGKSEPMEISRSIIVTRAYIAGVSVEGQGYVTAGGSIGLSADISPKDLALAGVEWQSSNSKIATVDKDGKVTGKAAGEVTITATARDGSGVYGSKKITVYGADPVNAAVRCVVTNIGIDHGYDIMVPSDGTTVSAQSAMQPRFTAKSTNSSGQVDYTFNGLVKVTQSSRIESAYADGSLPVVEELKSDGENVYYRASGSEDFTQMGSGEVVVAFYNMVFADSSGDGSLSVGVADWPGSGPHLLRLVIKQVDERGRETGTLYSSYNSMMYWEGTAAVNGVTFNIDSSRYDFAYDMVEKGKLPIFVEGWLAMDGNFDGDVNNRITTIERHAVSESDYESGGLTVPFRTAGAATTEINVVTAYVTEKSFTVSYDANLPEGITEVTEIPAAEQYKWKEQVAVSSVTPTCEGYTFIGWRNNGATYVGGNSFAMPQSDVTLQAHWVPNEQAIKYLPNNEDWGAVSRGGDVIYDESSDIIGSEAQPNDGYQFIGWYKAIDVNGKGMGEPVSTDLLYRPTDRTSATYFAVFEPESVPSIDLALKADDSEGLVYNTEYQTWHKYTIAEGALKDGDTLEVSFSGKSQIKDATAGSGGMIVNEVENVIESAKVMRNGTDVTSEYGTITFLPGTLTVAKAKAYLHAPSARKYYDGEALTASSLAAGNAIRYGGGLGGSLIQGDGTYDTGIWTEGIYKSDFDYVDGSVVVVRGEPLGSRTNAGVSPTDCSKGSAPVLHISKNYDLEWVQGSIEVLPRPATIIANSIAEEIPYDGASHALAGYTVSGMGIVDGETLTPSSDDVSVSGTEQGVYTLDPETYSFRVAHEGGVDSEAGVRATSSSQDYSDLYPLADATDNYVFSYVTGRMTIGEPIVLPEITLQAKSDTVVYNGAEQSVEGLSKNTFTYEGERYTVKVDVSARGVDAGTYTTKQTGRAAVTDTRGNDVTSKFNITIVAGTLTVKQREVTMKANDGEKDYDGTPLEASGFTVLAGVTSDEGLLSGHEVEADVSGSQTAPGSSASVVDENSVVITAADGQEATDNYAIIYKPGTLRVMHNTDKLVIDVEAQSGSFIYDGTERSVSGLIYNGVETENDVSVELTIDGETYTVSGLSASAKATDVVDSKAVDIVGAVQILDSKQQDVTKTFTVNKIDGELTVKQRPVTITANTNKTSIPYDFTAHTLSGYTVSTGDDEGIVSGEALSPASEAVSVTGTEVGEYELDPADCAFSVAKSDGTDSTVNYVFSYVPGTMTIVAATDKPAVVLQAKSDTVVYDGTEQSVEGLVEDAFEYAGQTYTVTAAVSAKGVEVGPYDTVQTGSATIVDAQGKNATSKFDLTISSGRLTIEQREVTVKAKDGKKDYDGTPLAASGYDVITTADSNGLLADHSLTAEVVGSRTLPGSSPSKVVKDSVAIVDASGASVIRNYRVVLDEGELVVSKSAEALVIDVTAASGSFVYDGTEKSVSGLTYNGGDAVESGASANVEVGGVRFTVFGLTAGASGTNASESAMVEVLGDVKILDADQNDVTELFTVNRHSGDFSIAKRPVTITANSNLVSIPYDFKEHTLVGYTVSSGENEGIVAGETLLPESDDVRVSGTEEGVYALDPETVGFTVAKEGDIETTENYSFSYVPGTMTIVAATDKPAVVLQAKSDTVVYDGTEQSVEGLVASTFEHEGGTYVVEVSVSARGTDANVYDTVVDGDIVVKDASDNDATSKFNVTVNPGKLTVEKRKVTVKAKDGEKYFDGTALEASGFEVIESADENAGLLPDSSLTAEVEGSQLSPGSSASTVVESSVAIVNGSNEAVTDNYLVELNPGTLTIKHNPQALVIDVVPNSGSFIYDGMVKNVSGLAYNGVASENGEVVQVAVDGEAFEISGLTAGAGGVNVSDSAAVNVVGNISIVDSRGKDVTSLFTVNKGSGAFAISPREVTITAATSSKDYDGRPLTDSRWSAERAQAGGDTGLIDEDDLVSVTVSGLQTTPGSSANIPSGAVFGEDVAGNYEPEYVNGTLTVRDTSDADHRIIDIAANSGIVAYNGVVQGVSGLTYNGSESNEVTFDDVTYTVEGLSAAASGTQAGTYAAPIKGQVVVRDPSGNDVTQLFTVNQAPGSLVIETVSLTVKAASDQKVYDGTALVNEAYEANGLIEGEKVESVHIIGSQTEVGSSANVASQAVVTRGGADVTDNYAIAYEDGVLTVLAASPEPSTPVNPLPTPDNPTVPADNPLDAVVAPVAETLSNVVETVINPNPTPQAGVGEGSGETAINDDETPLGMTDHGVFCWVHYYIILGIIITLIYGLAVIGRRRKFIGTLDGFERSMLDSEQGFRGGDDGRNA